MASKHHRKLNSKDAIKRENMAIQAYILHCEGLPKMQACVRAGYTFGTAKTHSKKIIERGGMLITEKTPIQKGKTLQLLGRTRADLVEAFNYIAFVQKKDLRTKLTALAPILRQEGIVDLTETSTGERPVLNIHVDEIHQKAIDNGEKVSLNGEKNGKNGSYSHSVIETRENKRKN